MQRIVFINLHANEFLLKTLSKYVFMQSMAIKHAYLLRWLLEQPNYEVASFVTSDGFSMGHSFGALGRLLQHFRFWEHRYILRRNGIPKGRVHLLKKSSQLRDDDIIIIHRHSLTADTAALANAKGLKVMAMVHFGGNEDHMSRFAREAGIDYFYNESDLQRHSTLFRQRYQWYAGKPVIVIPFVPAERFKASILFDQRENKAYATGTITYRTDPDFLEAYGDECVQPRRKAVKQLAQAHPDLLVCTSADYSEGVKLKPLPANAGFLRRLIFTWRYKTKASQQKSYYSFDMVEAFNKHKLCIVAEEVVGAPGIGFVEGMACGAALVGCDDSGYYSQYGLKPGVHFIDYDGTMADLEAKLRHWEDPRQADALRAIADAGCTYVRQHFGGPTVARHLVSELETLLQKKRLQ